MLLEGHTVCRSLDCAVMNNGIRRQLFDLCMHTALCASCVQRSRYNITSAITPRACARYATCVSIHTTKATLHNLCDMMDANTATLYDVTVAMRRPKLMQLSLIVLTMTQRVLDVQGLPSSAR
jgi:hypothetical protein